MIPFSMQHPDNLETPFQKYFPSFVQTGRVTKNWQGVRTLSRMVYSLEARRKMATLITDTKPDIAHIHNIYSQLSPSILDTLRDQKIPTVMTVHDHHLISPQYNIWAHGCGKDYRDVGVVRGTLSRFHKDSVMASFAQTAAYRFHRWLKITNAWSICSCVRRSMKRQLVREVSRRKIRVNYSIDPHVFTPHLITTVTFYAGRPQTKKALRRLFTGENYWRREDCWAA